MKVKVWRDPYDAGFNTTTPSSIEFDPGISIIIGCNGAGKTTLLYNIEDYCKDNKIPCHKFDNLQDGKTSCMSDILYGNEEEKAIAFEMTSSSEGECIKLSLSKQALLFREFLSTGHYKDRSYKLGSIFKDKEELENMYKDNKVRVLLFDALDSGLSIDSVIEIKSFFNLILEDSEKLGLETYIISTANEYELARHSKCFDVNTGKYIEINDYEDYRSFIIKSRKKKDIRIKKVNNRKIKKQQMEEKENKNPLEFRRERN